MSSSEPTGSAESANSGQETLTVKLKNYVLLSPETINLDDANRMKLQAVINQEPVALIECWAVDPDYDGRVFRSVWQDYRGNTANDGDALRVVTQAIVSTPAKPGPRPWHCVLLAEDVVYEWQGKGSCLADLLHYARLRPMASASLQQTLDY